MRDAHSARESGPLSYGLQERDSQSRSRFSLRIPRATDLRPEGADIRPAKRDHRLTGFRATRSHPTTRSLDEPAKKAG